MRLNLLTAGKGGKRVRPTENNEIFKDFHVFSAENRGLVTLLFTELEWAVRDLPWLADSNAGCAWLLRLIDCLACSRYFRFRGIGAGPHFSKTMFIYRL